METKRRPPTLDEIKAAAKALGRQGGLRGGPARAKALTPARRREIATVAGKAGAEARWGSKDKSHGT